MRQLQVVPLDVFDPEIGRWMWALEAVRQRTLRLVKDLDKRILDWEGPDGEENAIGSLLYHIALVEMSWLHEDVMQGIDLPLHVKPNFPFKSREPDRDHLTRVLGVPLAEHVDRLNRSREIFLEEMKTFSLEDWRRLRRPPDQQDFTVDYEVTPEWAVFHLVEHEAGHAFQISSLKARGTRMLAVEGKR